MIENKGPDRSGPFPFAMAADPYDASFTGTFR